MVFGELVYSAFLVSVFKVSPGLDSVREVVFFFGCNFWWRQDLPAVVQNFFQLLMGHAKQLVFAIGPDLVPVQLHEQLPEPLLQSLRSRNVATLGPSLSSRQSLFADLKRRSAASSFLHSSSLVSAMYAPHHRSPLPCSPTRAALLPKLIWHQTLRLHEPDA